MIRRKGKRSQPDKPAGDQPDEVAAGGPDSAADSAADVAAHGADTAPGEPMPDRSEGPFDISEVADPDASSAGRLDLGAVQLTLLDGLEVRVEMDPDSGEPAAVTIVRGEGAVQVRVFAAPRSGGGWREARGEIRSSITSDGGTVDEVTGRFGVELHTTAFLTDEQGNPVQQRMRFVGVDGPRWMLQGVLLGSGAVPETSDAVEEAFRSLTVVRGDTAMPPGAPLQLSLPEDVPGSVEQVSDDE